MASTAVASDIGTASLEDLLRLRGEVDAQIDNRVDGILAERRKARERIQAILREAGLDSETLQKRRRVKR